VGIILVDIIVVVYRFVHAILL